MKSRPSKSRQGLILLVVLGMLTLFSMLTITYVVFARQSVTANIGMARVDYRGTPAPKLLDEAMRIALRGTADPSSSLHRHDLLGDVYGQTEPSLTLGVRESQVGMSNVGSPMSVSAPERPRSTAGSFVRIPFSIPGVAIGSWPAQNDLWVGRVVTFLGGPLQNESFRVVRTIGDTRSNMNTAVQEQTFSLVIDLSEVQDRTAVAVVDRAGSTAGVFETVSQSISAWAANDFYNLFYSDANGGFSGAYQLLLNAAPYNAFGAGVTANGTSQTVRLTGALDNSTETDAIARGAFPAAFQPNLGAIPHQAVLPTGSVSDSDESYDAPDYKDQWLYHRFSDGSGNPPQSTDIIPSFHRAALINYIVNESDPASYSQPEQLIAVLQRVRAATGRPLSFTVRASNGTVLISVNPNFSGTNAGVYNTITTTGDDFRSPQLDITFDTGTWNTPLTGGLALFHNWVRLLTKGPWDVDNDDDGVNDSIWTDPNFPLMTSPEGKLLKALVAFQIEDLDSRLDMNAVGDLSQTDVVATYSNATTLDFGAGAGQTFTQGFGFGPAETSLRHLFTNGSNYQDFLRRRYRISTVTTLSNADVPGRSFDDLYSMLGIRETPIDFGSGPAGALLANNHRWRYRHATLPSLPLATRGRQALGVDLLGNPLVLSGTDGVSVPPVLTDPPFDEFVNSPYESRVLTGGAEDSLYTFSQWERVERQYDQDRTAMSQMLNGVSADDMHLLTPRSRHSRLPVFAANRGGAGAPGASSQSFYETIEAIALLKSVTLDNQMYSELFPFEFGRGELLNLNRALGNGFDDDNDGQFDEPQELGAAVFDGIDNDGDGITDEIDESNGPTESQRTVVVAGQSLVLSTSEYESYLLGATALDPAYDALSVAERQRFYGSQTRQLLARHLYCLAMLVMPDAADFVPSNLPAGQTLTPADRARILAQWAVNVVDFRDADSAMTRFAYDPEPFVNGGSGPYWAPDVTANPATVVWGMEQPEVVMSESLAFHDVRVRDTAEDSTGDRTTDTNTNDNTFDQLRVPEGSAFVELRALRTTTVADNQSVPGVASSLYGTNAAGRVALDLGRVTPPNAANVQFPVFRIAVSESHSIGQQASPPRGTVGGTPAEVLQDPNRRRTHEYQFPNVLPNLTPAPPSPNGLVWERGNASNLAPRIDRVVWFTDSLVPSYANLPDVNLPGQDGINDAEEARSRVYDNRFGQSVMLEGGQQLVVGPRAITYIGSKQTADVPLNPINNPNDHRIVMQNNTAVANNTPAALNNWVTMYDGSNNLVNRRAALTDNNTAGGNSRTLTMIAATIPDWDPSVTPTTGNLPTEIGFNVTAPHPIFGEYYDTPTDQLNSSDTAGDPNGALGYGDANQPADAYFDYGGSSPNFLINTPFDGRDEPRFPLGNGQTWQPGYQDGFPQPGTVENWCTAYLQRLADPERPWHATLNPYITIDWIPFDVTVFSGEDQVTAPAALRFASRQKTGVLMDVDQPPAATTTANSGKTFLSLASEGISNDPATRVSGAFFDRQLPMDLPSAGDPTLPEVPRPTTQSTHLTTLGFLNSPYRLRGELDSNGAIQPFRQGFEGAPADVPASLLWMDRQFANAYEMLLVPTSHPGQLMQEFSQRSTMAGNYYNQGERIPYPYLMNWFQQPVASGGPLPSIGPSAIFELIDTPSPWAEANKHIPAASVSGSLSLASMRAPYNWVPRFVEPGRININTVSSPHVWQGLMWNTNPAVANRTAKTSTPAFWNTFMMSRQGYTTGAAGVVPSPNPRLHPDLPTQFNGVFKSSFAAGMTPQLRSAASIPLDGPARQNPIQTTLARGNASQNGPLLAPAAADGPAYASNVPQAAFEEFQQFSRIKNLTTTRSNVFAVRVTVGLFEYDAATGLGQEYGEDQGRARRHRAFYVIDRSVPVGYREGQDLNTDNCILVRRIIE